MKRILAIVLLGLIPAFLLADCTKRVVVTQKVVTQKVVVVPKIVAVEVYRDHYYSLDPYYQQQALAAQIIRQLRAELREKKTTPTAGPTPKVEQGPAPKIEQVEPVAGKYQNEKLLAIVNDSCAKCHGATSKQTRLVTKDGKALADIPSGKAWEAFGLVNSGEMPKAADSVNDEGVKLFYDWAKNARRE